MPSGVYDLAVVGGGINGAGIAADAAGRGLKVVLFEKGDLASGTSSASSKLIHGGLRYLEHWELRLVREALIEREVLLARAPHLIRPLRFVIPHAAGMRPRSLMRLGLFLYDHLAARRRIPASGTVDLARDPAGRPLRAAFQAGLSYYDCLVDDARLVAMVAMDAAERGAAVHTRTPVTRLARQGGVWEITGEGPSGTMAVAARVLVNAAGPWCAEVAGLVGSQGHVPTLRLVRGTHIVVPRIDGAEDAYLLQNPDGRVVFALPFERAFTLIGTTEVDVTRPEDGFAASDAEEAYLLATAGRFFSHALAKDDIVWRFAGVRPLVEDGASRASAVSRDYRLDLVASEGQPPLLNVIGGKITTFRRLAEAALTRLAPFFPGVGAAWTAYAPLPGGDVGADGIEAYGADLARRHRGLSEGMLKRLVSLYGTRAERVLGDAKKDADLGQAIGGGLTEREVIYLRDHEWARTAEDVLWRRTKAGLHIGDAAQRTQAEAMLSRLLASADGA
ncbi:glycerol-3-phosphate dehydrogenase [Hyphomicrobium sp.]|uniref:glycerol-3-phosphate dehydrogenase n=1 Tax=Hyphomicrobium sp. TaxID=82 RepID=UPI0025BB93BF|nr:glycerol-3-phosphate dehydrogenase [Hyphomicrobium sp.]MCC7252438.1 glycerol-3-phosphate dehydrogenase [Hyphomicrobium sp.]